MRIIHHALTGFAILMLAAGVSPAQSATTEVVYEPGTNLAVDAEVDASSAAGQPGARYSVDGINDEYLDTWWASGANRDLPQWVRLSFDAPVTLDTAVFLQVDNPHIYANASVIELEFSDGSTVQEELDDHPGPFIVRFPARSTEWVRLSILETHEEKVYYGARQIMVFHDADLPIDGRLLYQTVAFENPAYSRSTTTPAVSGGRRWSSSPGNCCARWTARPRRASPAPASPSRWSSGLSRRVASPRAMSSTTTICRRAMAS